MQDLTPQRSTIPGGPRFKSCNRSFVRPVRASSLRSSVCRGGALATGPTRPRLGATSSQSVRLVSSVLLLHAWWGRTPVFAELGRRFEDAGFRVESRTCTGTGEPLEAEELMGRVERARQRLPEPVGLVGFSLGAAAAASVLLRESALRAGVLYYGTSGVPEDAPTSAAVLGHLAERDPFEPPDGVRPLPESRRGRVPSARSRAPARAAVTGAASPRCRIRGRAAPGARYGAGRGARAAARGRAGRRRPVVGRRR